MRIQSWNMHNLGFSTSCTVVNPRVDRSIYRSCFVILLTRHCCRKYETELASQSAVPEAVAHPCQATNHDPHPTPMPDRRAWKRPGNFHQKLDEPHRHLKESNRHRAPSGINRHCMIPPPQDSRSATERSLEIGAHFRDRSTIAD